MSTMFGCAACPKSLRTSDTPCINSALDEWLVIAFRCSSRAKLRFANIQTLDQSL